MSVGPNIREDGEYREAERQAASMEDLSSKEGQEDECRRPAIKPTGGLSRPSAYRMAA